MIDNIIEKIGVDVMVQSLILKGQGLHSEQADKNTDGELARAAAAYALGAKEIQIPLGPNTTINHRLFPFADHVFKPSSYRDDLIQACALLMHEVARIDRYNQAMANQPITDDDSLPQIFQGMVSGTMPAGTDFSNPSPPMPMAAKDVPPPLKEAVAARRASQTVQDKIIILKDRTAKKAKVVQRNLRHNLHSFWAVAFA